MATTITRAEFYAADGLLLGYRVFSDASRVTITSAGETYGLSELLQFGIPALRPRTVAFLGTNGVGKEYELGRFSLPPDWYGDITLEAYEGDGNGELFSRLKLRSV